MRIPWKSAHIALTELLDASGASAAEVRIMVDLRLDYDLYGNTFSGFEEIPAIFSELKSSCGKHETLEVDLPSLKLFNAQGRSSKLVACEQVPLLCEMAKTQGLAAIGIFNSTYHGTLESYVRAIAKQDLIGIASANGGPQGVLPFGGSKDVCGTNPLAYAIPTLSEPIVFDAATAAYAYGTIRLARAQAQKLPDLSYVDKAGQWTTDPHAAIAIVPFGGHKGFAINLLLEMLTGALVRGKSGTIQSRENELGSFLLAINPAALTDMVEFKRQASELVTAIEQSPPLPGIKEVRAPGIKGARIRQQILASGFLDIDEHIWKEFSAFYAKTLNKAPPI